MGSSPTSRKGIGYSVYAPCSPYFGEVAQSVERRQNIPYRSLFVAHMQKNRCEPNGSGLSLIRRVVAGSSPAGYFRRLSRSSVGRAPKIPVHPLFATHQYPGGDRTPFGVLVYQEGKTMNCFYGPCPSDGVALIALAAIVVMVAFVIGQIRR